MRYPYHTFTFRGKKYTYGFWCAPDPVDTTVPLYLFRLIKPGCYVNEWSFKKSHVFAVPAPRWLANLARPKFDPITYPCSANQERHPSSSTMWRPVGSPTPPVVMKEVYWERRAEAQYGREVMVAMRKQMRDEGFRFSV